MSITDRLLAAEKVGDAHARPTTVLQRSAVLDDLKKRSVESLFRRIGSRINDASLTDIQLRDFVRAELEVILQEEHVQLGASERAQLMREIEDDALGLGPIQRLLDDDDISEIMVNHPSQIFVERKGKLTLADESFSSEDQLRRVIERIVGKVGRRIDESSPLVDARLTDGSRVNAVIPPLAVRGSSLTIRKFAKKALSIQDLINYGSMSPELAELLELCVRGRLNILVSGGTGTGKTTLLNVLSSFIPEDERIVTIEDAIELKLQQAHVVQLEARPANIEGRGEVTIRDLVKNSLRMRPDRVVIGECRSGEALDMLQAMNTGHDGSISTLHANSPRDCIARLETLVLMAGMDLPLRAIREQIGSAVDMIVQISRLRDGSRRITYVTELVGIKDDEPVLRDLYRFDFGAGYDEDGHPRGTVKAVGDGAHLVDLLDERGIKVPPHLLTLRKESLS
ncbi:CpaF family protein [Aeromicrobium duanguangcaii]|uniref:CpaF family protein n=1 Tax=Aeromicrobium duanguangcaii TaxID=2968086 RepID=A0ABY5KBT0_9ACTN|nr:CpaF family protein [Aeromicrobium duanguangcaii]MCD9154662.1 CpaF family protein [Aeromicrobium duanguangcaii]UUI67924.1 CpaF family protein [Aeromicrobium duanguangcaii]